MTVPGYPVFGTHAKWYGGEVYNLKLTEENDFLPDLDSIPRDVLQPREGDGAELSEQPDRRERDTGVFCRSAVEFARKHSLVIVSDAAYAALVFEGRPLSILQRARRERGGRRVAFDEQSVQHDRLAAGLRRAAIRCS